VGESSNSVPVVNLRRFQEKVSAARRQSGQLQKDLAAALGIDGHVLSRKLHGSGRDQLTHYEVKQIIKTLAAWDAITTQAEAIELLMLMRLRRESFSPEEWESVPLSRLDKLSTGLSTTREAFSTTSSSGQTQSILPLPSTSLIGREWAIKLVSELLLQDEVRLLTLLGAAGVGKTRLSLAVAAALQEEFADGVFFVPLGDLDEAALVPSTIAEVFDLVEPVRGASFAQVSPFHERLLKSFLREKNVLLVLDNFEHLLDAAVFLGKLLEATPHLKVLVTSRVTLPLNGGYEFGVPPLEVPDPATVTNPADLAQFPATRLFVERVKAVNPQFVLTGQNVATVARLCLRLEGLPLASELAAARSRLLSPQAVLERLAGSEPVGQHGKEGLSLSFLRQQARNMPVRQQTLLYTLDWSYHLLDRQAQQLFTRLGVFVGGWTLEAALIICQDEDMQADAEDMFEQIEGLVNQSLVVPMSSTQHLSEEESMLRFRFLEPIREYALKRLREGGERETIQELHARYYLRLIEQIEPDLGGNQRRRAVQHLVREQDNLRAALAWTIGRGEAELAQRLCGVLGLFWESRTQFQEAHHWIDAALEAGTDTPVAVRAKLFLAAARLANWEMALEQSRKFAQEALVLYEACGDDRGRARALFQVGDSHYMQGEYPQAIRYMEEALHLQRTLNEQRDYAFTLGRLGAIAMLQGDLDRAEADLTETVAFFRELGEPLGLSSVLIYLGVLAVVQGKLLQALGVFREDMVLAQEIGQHFNLAIALSAIGCTLGLAESAKAAAQLCSAAEVLFEQLGSAFPPAYRPLYTSYLTSIKAQVDEETWETWWIQGRRLTSEQAVALALAECQQVLS
jgi:predicted ATPase